MTRPSAVAALGLVLAMGSGAAGSAGGSSDAPFRCRVTEPTQRPLPARPAFNFGNARVAVDLPERATFVAVPDGRPGNAFVQANGWIRAKLGWWSARGALRVRGRRLDRRARPLRADVGPVSWLPSGDWFLPSLLYFPSTGCWGLTAAAGGARLEAVVRVLRA